MAWNYLSYAAVIGMYEMRGRIYTSREINEGNFSISTEASSIQSAASIKFSMIYTGIE